MSLIPVCALISGAHKKEIGNAYDGFQIINCNFDAKTKIEVEESRIIAENFGLYSKNDVAKRLIISCSENICRINTPKRL